MSCTYDKIPFLIFSLLRNEYVCWDMQQRIYNLKFKIFDKRMNVKMNYKGSWLYKYTSEENSWWIVVFRSKCRLLVILRCYVLLLMFYILYIIILLYWYVYVCYMSSSSKAALSSKHNLEKATFHCNQYWFGSWCFDINLCLNSHANSLGV